MVSMQDIADKAGVSRVTVSRVLSNHPSVKAETRKKVLYWVKELEYEPNVIAQSLAGSSTNVIGLLVPEIAYPFFSEIIEAVENQAFYAGYHTIICNTRRSPEKERNILTELKKRKVDGIIAVPVSAVQTAAYQRLSIPVVMITKRAEGFSSSAVQTAAYQRLSIPVVMITKRAEGFSSVYISHYTGGQQIARHFLNVGFQRIGYIGPIRDSTSAIKYAGFQNYLAENRIDLTDVIECPAPANMNASLVYAKVKEYAASTGLRCEAYLANDDITACEAIAAFRELGYAVPKDIAIAGFDNSLLAKEISPKLTALAQPLEEIGKKAVEVLLAQIHDGVPPQMYELESRVIVRESTIHFVPAQS